MSSSTWFSRAFRIAIMLVVAVSAVAVVNVATARHSYAWSCQSYNSNYINDGSAALYIAVGRGCDDHLAHVWGTVYDVNCDGRSAQTHIYFYDGGTNFWNNYRNEYPSDGNGCGSSATFGYGTTRQWPSIYARVWAGNGGPTQSSGADTWV